MRKLILAAMVMGLLMSACAGGRWVKQDMTQYNEDIFDCDYKATMMSSGVIVVLERGILGKLSYQKDAYNNCIKSKGYHYERNK